MDRSFLLGNARWLSAGILLTLASSFGQTFFISLFKPEIMATYNLSEGGWGAIYTVATLGSAAALVMAGRFADQVPVARLAAVILTGYAAVAVGMSLNENPVILVLLIFGLRFCGQGMISHLGITAMGRWFQAHRGRAVAIAGLGYALGEAILPPLVGELLPWIGWRAIWFGVALVLVGVYLPLAVWLSSNERHPRGIAAAALSPGRDGQHWTRRKVLKGLIFWMLVPAIVAASFIGTVIFFQMTHIGQIMGWGRADMAVAYPLYAAMAVVTALVSGWLADRFGPDRLLPLFLLPSGTGMLLIGPFEGIWAWYGALALTGMTSGIANGMWGAFWPEIYGTRHLGAIKAVASAFMVIGSAIGPGVTGALIDLDITYADQAPWMFAATVAISALHLGVVSRLPARPAPALPS